MHQIEFNRHLSNNHKSSLKFLKKSNATFVKHSLKESKTFLIITMLTIWRNIQALSKLMKMIFYYLIRTYGPIAHLIKILYVDLANLLIKLRQADWQNKESAKQNYNNNFRDFECMIKDRHANTLMFQIHWFPKIKDVKADRLKVITMIMNTKDSWNFTCKRTRNLLRRAFLNNYQKLHSEL